MIKQNWKMIRTGGNLRTHTHAYVQSSHPVALHLLYLILAISVIFYFNLCNCALFFLCEVSLTIEILHPIGPLGTKEQKIGLGNNEFQCCLLMSVVRHARLCLEHVGA